MLFLRKLRSKKRKFFRNLNKVIQRVPNREPLLDRQKTFELEFVQNVRDF